MDHEAPDGKKPYIYQRGYSLSVDTAGRFLRTQLSVLTENELAEIKEASLRILSEIGLKVMSKEALEILGKAGAETDVNTSIARMPEKLVEEAIDSAPKKITLHARDPKQDSRLYDREYPALTTDGIAVRILDLEANSYRRSTSKDLFKLAILADYLTEVEIFWPMVVAGDVPENEHTVKEFAISMLGTSKHIQHEAAGKLEARAEIEIAQAVVGGKDELRKRPIFSAVQCPVSPLMFERNSAEAAIELSRAGIPIAGMSITQSGSTAPATLASTLALANAETLAALVLTQVVSKGNPFIYATSSAPVDIHGSGMFLAGSPELALISAAFSQLARSYGLPSLVAGMITDARYPSQQASYEKLQTGLLPALAGATIVSGIGGLDTDNAISFEQMIIDSEIWSGMMRIARGIEVDAESICMDLMKQMGSSPSYGSDIETLKKFKKEVWQPKLPFRQTYAAWKAAGAKSIESMANERVKEIVAKHQPTAMGGDLERAIMGIYKRFQKGMQGEVL